MPSKRVLLTVYINREIIENFLSIHVHNMGFQKSLVLYKKSQGLRPWQISFQWVNILPNHPSVGSINDIPCVPTKRLLFEVKHSNLNALCTERYIAENFYGCIHGRESQDSRKNLLA